VLRFPCSRWPDTLLQSASGHPVCHGLGSWWKLVPGLRGRSGGEEMLQDGYKEGVDGSEGRLNISVPVTDSRNPEPSTTATTTSSSTTSQISFFSIINEFLATVLLIPTLLRIAFDEMFGFGGKSFDPEKDIGNLSGKVVLVTGGELRRSTEDTSFYHSLPMYKLASLSLSVFSKIALHCHSCYCRERFLGIRRALRRSGCNF